MPSTGPRTYPFDARPLTDPVDNRAVHAFTSQMRARGTRSSSATTIIAIIVVVIIAAVFAAVAIPLLALIVVSAARENPALAAVVAAIAVVIIAGILTGIGMLIWSSVRKNRVARYRLHRFAQANGMSYQDAVANPPLPGMIFTLGHARKAERLVRGYSPRFVEFGNYQYTTGSGKNSTTHDWGYSTLR